MTRIVLYQPPGEGALSYSPYCNKVRWALELKRLPFESVTTTAFRRESRTGKLPVLALDGERVHDSTEIVHRLEGLQPDPALVPHDPRLAAQVALLEAWADESLCALVTYERARDPDARRRMVSSILAFKRLPAVFAPLVERRLRRSGRNRYGHLLAHGPAVVRAELLRHLDVVDRIADGREWLVGAAPTLADVAVAACFHVARIGRVAEVLSLIVARPHARAWFDRFLARVDASRRAAAEAA